MPWLSVVCAGPAIGTGQADSAEIKHPGSYFRWNGRGHILDIDFGRFLHPKPIAKSYLKALES